MTKPSRLRLALRCSTVLVGVAGIAVLSEQPRRRRHAAEQAARLGGYVTYGEAYRHDHVPPPAPRTPDATWLREQLGPELVHELTVLNLNGKPLGDADREPLGGLRGLRMLHLSGTPVTDAGLAHLACLSDLRSLELRETRVGDAGLRHLEALGRIEELYLYGTRVGDAGMRSLSRLSGLRALSMSRTALGGADVLLLDGRERIETAVILLHLGQAVAALPVLRRAEEDGDAGSGGSWRRRSNATSTR